LIAFTGVGKSEQRALVPREGLPRGGDGTLLGRTKVGVRKKIEQGIERGLQDLLLDKGDLASFRKSCLETKSITSEKRGKRAKGTIAKAQDIPLGTQSEIR